MSAVLPFIIILFPLTNAFALVSAFGYCFFISSAVNIYAEKPVPCNLLLIAFTKALINSAVGIF